MTKKKKWEIDGLDENKSLLETAAIVLEQRITIFEKSLNKYFKNDSVENLHEVRIAIRRLRYNMEIFISCFSKKKYLKYYKTIVRLQDLTGSKRDFDVFLQNIEQISSSEKINANIVFIEIIKEKIEKVKKSLNLELRTYWNSGELKDFQKLIDKTRS